MRPLRAVFAFALLGPLYFSAAVVVAQPNPAELMVKECVGRGVREIPKATTSFLPPSDDTYSGTIVAPARTQEKFLAAAKEAAVNCIDSKSPNKKLEENARTGSLSAFVKTESFNYYVVIPAWHKERGTGVMRLQLLVRHVRPVSAGPPHEFLLARS